MLRIFRFCVWKEQYNTVTLFADDTPIYCSLKEGHQNIEQDLQKISNWIEENQLKFNHEKSKFLEIN